MEPNEINVLARTVFRHVEQVDYVLEPAGPCEIRTDVAERNRDDRIDFDFAVLHAVSLTGPYVRALPHADAGRDRTRAHAVAKIFDEEQAASLDRGEGKDPECARRLLVSGPLLLGRFDGRELRIYGVRGLQ